MDLIDRALIAAVAKGIPLSPKPFAAIGETLGTSELETLERLQRLIALGIVRRFGLIVRHRELGYVANAMVVWDVPDDQVRDIGQRLGVCQEVTLCYRRARRPGWPYNLFTMIHGRDRSIVEAQIEALAMREGISEVPRETLFSLRCFKQCGASYDPSPEK